MKIEISVQELRELGILVEDNPKVKDSIVNSVLDKYVTRSEVGQKKYNTNLDRTDLAPSDWLLHAQEEAMDLSLYLEKLIKTDK
jgi:hypothetical protein